MNFARIKRDGNHYFTVEYGNDSLWILAQFLVSAIDSSPLSYALFTNWLKGTNSTDYNGCLKDLNYTSCTGVQGNAFGLEEKNGRVYAYFLYDPEEEWFKYFNTTKENMLKIIDDWARTICQQPEPNTILITEENEQVTFTVED